MTRRPAPRKSVRPPDGRIDGMHDGRHTRHALFGGCFGCMSTPSTGNPYTRFRRDHSRLLSRLPELESTAPGRGRPVREEPLARHVRLLEQQFDTHMAAEEAILYPTLAQALPG